MDEGPLGLESRRRLHRLISNSPGTYLRELQRGSGMAMGALEYHLDQLLRAGLITVQHDGNKRFFPVPMPAQDKAVLSALRQRLPRRILVVVLDEGACPRVRLADRLDVAPSTLTYHLQRLVEHGILRDSGEGRDRAYDVADREEVLRLLVTYQESFLDRVVDGFLEGVDAMR